MAKVSQPAVTGLVGTVASMSNSVEIKDVYFVYLKDVSDKPKGKVAIGTKYWDLEPPEDVWLGEIFAAESPGKARVYFMKHFSYHVGPEDWVNIRVRKVGVSVQPGVIYGVAGMYGNKSYETFWDRIHEILDHDNKPCNCGADLLGLEDSV